MEPDDQFAEWAALFFSSYSDHKTGAAPAGLLEAPSSGVQYVGVTPAACELLRSVDAGGVPTFVTSNLKQIAKDNGIEVIIHWTPNEIVDAIRRKASIDSSGLQVSSD